MSESVRSPIDTDKPLDEWSDAEKRELLDSVEELDIEFAESLRRFRERHAKPAEEAPYQEESE